MTFSWPPILRPSSEAWHLENTSRSGGVSLTGGEQVVSSGASRWRARLTLAIRKPAEVLAWRGLLASLQGRAGTVALGPKDTPQIAWPVNEYGRKVTPRSVGNPQLAGTIFADPPIVTNAIVIGQITVAAPLRATFIRYSITTGAVLLPGHYIGIGGRLYVVSETGEGSCSIQPPLRTATPAGTAIEIQAPTTPMRLASDDSGELELQLMRFGTVSVDFQESLV